MEVQSELLEEEKETQPDEKLQKGGEDEAVEGKQHGEEVMEMLVVSSDEEQKGDSRELVGGSLFSSSIPSPSSRPLRNIDSIVDKHLGNFSSEMQLLLHP